MATRRNNQTVPSSYNKLEEHTGSHENSDGYYNSPNGPPPPVQRASLILPPDFSALKKSFTTYKGIEYQLMPIEIEKEAELGLVIGQIDREQWIFIDEILPNGMIEMHGILKEGDYIIQAGVYSLVGVDVTIALSLIERAYDEGKKTVSFVAARVQKADVPKQKFDASTNNKDIDYKQDRIGSRARSFVDYEMEELEEPVEPVESVDVDKNTDNYTNTQF